MDEQWRAIESHPGYEVSSLARVRRATDGRHKAAGEVLSQVTVRGYLNVSLFIAGKRKLVKVHRLVALAFLPPAPDGFDQVAHNDGSTTNNVPTNLRWATGRDNLGDRAAHGTELRGVKNGRSKLTPEDVAYIRANYKRRCPVNGANKLAERFGVTDVAVIKAARGANWAHITAA